MSSSPFSAVTESWFATTFGQPTPIQRDGWPEIATGKHTLLLAPTGNGKTLAAFLWCIDRLLRDTPTEAAGVRVLYVSPLKALAHDVEKNLRQPLAGMWKLAASEHANARPPTVAIRTGDTSQKERRYQARSPADILVTTPESLYLMLGSAVSKTLQTVTTVIIDEVHALAPTKRGAHLALSLERLSARCESDPQRIGLSATARPAAIVSRFLGGDRPVQVVDRTNSQISDALDIEVVIPTQNDSTDTDPNPHPRSTWDAIYPEILQLIRSHKSTIVFVNSRGLCERLCHKINELAEQKLARAHHGSISHSNRKQIENALKQGELAAIVATSSLELGIDMGQVDLVILVESPGSVARGLQRIGRAGHSVGQRSCGRIFPKHPGDLLEAAVLSKKMLNNEIESLTMPENPLDVLAQQIVAMVASAPQEPDSPPSMSLTDLARQIRRTANYSTLSDKSLRHVLDMLAGRYPSHDFSDLRPRIIWDRHNDILTPRRGSKMMSLISGGTIPDRGLYHVHAGRNGPRIGELDEEMVFETRKGQAITLGASTWRVRDITRDRVIVEPAPGETGTLPFWRGDGPGRPVELGYSIGKLCRRVAATPPAKAREDVRNDLPVESHAANELVHYIHRQMAATGTVPSDTNIVIESFRDELGDRRICIHSFFGSRVHQPWALAIEHAIRKQPGLGDAQVLVSDNGLMLRLPEAKRPINNLLNNHSILIPHPDHVEKLVIEQLDQSPLFAGLFRENAARALLLPRKRADGRTPLWAQRLRSQNLLAVCREFPTFPIVLETYRSCLNDSFDVPDLRKVLRSVHNGSINVHTVETERASPFARTLTFAYIAAHIYNADTPAAERRSHALRVDYGALSDALGKKALRELFSPSAVDDVESVLQCRSPRRRAQNADHLHDILRRLGDLSTDELEERCDTKSQALVEILNNSGRAMQIQLCGTNRWIAVEDFSLYRDALGASASIDVPIDLLATVARPLEKLISRYACTHGPFTTADLAKRYDLAPSEVEAVLSKLQKDTQLHLGNFDPRGMDDEWCQADVLRRIRRKTLTELRREIAPVDADTYARFLADWHGILGTTKQDADRPLEHVLSQLEGYPLSFSELERTMLPSRMRHFQPDQLDQLGATGATIWIGRGRTGPRLGHVAIYRREQFASLWYPNEQVNPENSTEHNAILEALSRRGAQFLAELLSTIQAGKASSSTPNLECLIEAIWDLVWQGKVTNDTFQVLRWRHTVGRSPNRSRSTRQRLSTVSHAAGGRWSLVNVDSSSEGTNAPDRQIQTRAMSLLNRYGVISKSTFDTARFPGGFSAYYPVLRLMEEQGRIRRGLFVNGLEGVQFALPEAVDRLRDARDSQWSREAIHLSTIDPANPYGSLIAWPDSRGPRPRRQIGSSIILRNGALAFYLDRSGKLLIPFVQASNNENIRALQGCFEELARQRRGKYLGIERIGDDRASRSPLRQPLMDIGFRRDYKGLVLETT